VISVLSETVSVLVLVSVSDAVGVAVRAELGEAGAVLTSVSLLEEEEFFNSACVCGDSSGSDWFSLSSSYRSKKEVMISDTRVSLLQGMANLLSLKTTYIRHLIHKNIICNIYTKIL